MSSYYNFSANIRPFFDSYNIILRFLSYPSVIVQHLQGIPQSSLWANGSTFYLYIVDNLLKKNERTIAIEISFRLTATIFVG